MPEFGDDPYGYNIELPVARHDEVDNVDARYFGRCNHALAYRHTYGIRPVISWCEKCGSFKVKDLFKTKGWQKPIQRQR